MPFKLLKFKPTITKQQAIIYAALSGFFFFLFLLFTLLVRMDVLRGLDFDTTVRLQNLIPIRIDPYFSSLSILGRFEFTIVILGLLLLIRRQVLGLIIIGLFGLGHVIEIIGKMTLNQPGPPHMFLRTHFTDFPGLYVHTQASYPSGHSMRTVILAMLITMAVFHIKKLPLLFKMVVLGMMAGIVILMLVSRVSLGEHWTTDIVGGALLGASIGFLSLIFL